jgi:hypothetical protein
VGLALREGLQVPGSPLNRPGTPPQQLNHQNLDARSIAENRNIEWGRLEREAAEMGVGVEELIYREDILRADDEYFWPLSGH